jgi:glycerol-3-phosphate dehydrogenase
MYDLIVIGGGIQGVGVAQASAACGYRTLVLEQTALAAATSSRSSKLIHGGLRYLESGQLGLVRKALLERRILLRIAPQLVKLQPFYIPVYRGGSRGRWKIRTGLSMYALLAGLDKQARFHQLPSSAWSGLNGLKQDGLQAVFCYRDAQTDDAALTRAVMASAQNLGAQLQCPARFIRAEARQEGIVVIYQDAAGKEQHCRTRVLVNAAGPWVGRILDVIAPKGRQFSFDLVQGSHILMDVPAPAGVFYVEAPEDQRLVFVMPWHGKTLLGTTETCYRGEPGEVSVREADIRYLQSIYQYYFPHNPDATVVASFAGLRVLPRSSGTLFDRPRDTVIDISLPRVITLYGGKLTGYRATAQQVIKRAQRWLPSARRARDTADIVLPLASG